MVLVEKTRPWARNDIVEETKRYLFGTPKPVLDLTGIIKGVVALEDMDLYNMEEDVGRSTTRIDFGVELYDMEANWD
jgi:hypothetical protein